MGRIRDYDLLEEFKGDETFIVETDEGTKSLSVDAIKAQIAMDIEDKSNMLNQITIDTELSEESSNPIANKAVYNVVSDIANVLTEDIQAVLELIEGTNARIGFDMLELNPNESSTLLNRTGTFFVPESGAVRVEYEGYKQTISKVFSVQSGDILLSKFEPNAISIVHISGEDIACIYLNNSEFSRITIHELNEKIKQVEQEMDTKTAELTELIDVIFDKFDFKITGIFGGSVFNEYTITGRQNITPDGNTIKFGDDVIMTAPSPSSMGDAFINWMIDGQSVSDGSSYQVTKDISVKPLYNGLTGEIVTVTLDDDPDKTQKIVFDKKCKVFAENAYALAVKVGENDYRVAAYGDTYEYYVNTDREFYTIFKDEFVEGRYIVAASDAFVIEDEETINKLNKKLPFAYCSAANTNRDRKRYTSFNAYSKNISEDIKVLECGTIAVKAMGDAVTEENFVIDGVINDAKVNKYVSNTQQAFSNQYSLSIAGVVGQTLSVRPYVKYQYVDDTTNETITIVEYGNICDGTMVS